MKECKNPVAGYACRADAVKAFFEVLDRHGERMDRTRRKMEDIYAFRTPESPYFEFGITEGYTYEKSTWVSEKYDGGLDNAMQNIAFLLEALPETDYIPAFGVGNGRSDLIPTMFGVEFDYTPDGGLLNRSFYIEDMDSMPERVSDMPEVDVLKVERVAGMLEHAAFMLEMTRGRVDMTYPQLQGPFTNMVRFMPQEEALCATMVYPEAVKTLGEKIWRIAVDIEKAFVKAAGDTGALRPRARFYQPKRIKGLLVEDYISVLKPEVFLELFSGVYEMTYKEIGPVFQHTCGPVSQCAEIFKSLPGLVGFETAFARNQSKTTKDIEELKAALAGKVVMNSFELPFGEPVQDMENFTEEWLWKISEGGGIALRGAGPLERGKELVKKLGK